MYSCLKSNCYTHSLGYSIIAIRAQDIEAIRCWRNAQQSVLRQTKEITPTDQQMYFEKEIFSSFNQKTPKQILFSYLLNNDCIGYGGLVGIDWINQRAEVSFLLNPNRVKEKEVYIKDFSSFLQLLAKVAYTDLPLHRLYTETFAFRLTHLKVLESQQFKFEGQWREHVYKNGQWWDSILHGQLKHEWLMNEK